MKFFALLFFCISTSAFSQTVTDLEFNREDLQNEFRKSAHQKSKDQNDKSIDRFFPGANDLVQRVVNRLDVLQVHSVADAVEVRMVLEPRSLYLALRSSGEALPWQLYGIQLSKETKFQFQIVDTQIMIKDIEGIKLYVQIPWLPNGIWPKLALADANTQMLDLHFSTLFGFLRIVTEVDVKYQDFVGIKIGETIKENVIQWMKWSLFFVGMPFTGVAKISSEIVQ